jgi:endoglycosylceramidase
MRALVGVLGLAALLAGCGSSRLPATDPGTAAGAALHREGRWMVDDQGRIVLLHGVNVVWKLAPYAPPETPAGFTAADADFLADNGFNAVRLGVLFAGVMPQPGVIDPNYLDQIDRTVKLLAARRIWVLLDFHQDQLNEKYQGEGFPAWAVDDGGLPDDARYGFPANELLSLALNTAYDRLWANKDGVWSQYAAAWTAVASRWKNQPYLLGYDLFNEPWPGTRWPTCFERDCTDFDAVLQSFLDAALAGVRAADTAHLVFFEPQQLFDFGAPSHFAAETDPLLGLSWHDYCSAAVITFTAPLHLPVELPDCPIIEPRTMNNADAQAERLGAVSLLTEFGASDDLADIARVAALADAHLVGWTYWAYKFFGDPTGSGQAESLFADDADLSTLKAGKADLLIRPYAQAIAGTPTAMNFDPSTKVFTLAYTPNAARAPTVIFLPARHYPNGYAVTVSGGHAVSAPGAASLEIVNDPGAPDVQVEVRPS